MAVLTHSGVAFKAHGHPTNLAFLSTTEHSKLGEGAYGADSALLDALFDIFLDREGLKHDHYIQVTTRLSIHLNFRPD